MGSGLTLKTVAAVPQPWLACVHLLTTVVPVALSELYGLVP